MATAVLGVVLLLSSEFVNLAGRPLGTLMMLVAAAAWGYGTHLMRRHLMTLPALSLTFWMLALALAVMLIVTALFERTAWRAPDAREWASIAYNMVLAIAFCHVVWSLLARTLPPVASGLSVMMIPVVGVFSSMWLLGEQPGWQDYVALVLILISLSTVLLGPAAAGEGSGATGCCRAMSATGTLPRGSGRGQSFRRRRTVAAVVNISIRVSIRITRSVDCSILACCVRNASACRVTRSSSLLIGACRRSPGHALRRPSQVATQALTLNARYLRIIPSSSSSWYGLPRYSLTPRSKAMLRCFSAVREVIMMIGIARVSLLARTLRVRS